MTFGNTEFSALPVTGPSVVSPVPTLVRIGDDWPIARVIKDSTVASATLVSGGQNFTSPPLVVIDSPSQIGVTAKATATIAGGAVTGLVFSDHGVGYDGDNPPGIAFSGGGGTGASAVAVVGNPIDLTGATVTAELFVSYSLTPVQLTGGNGSVAVVDAVNGAVSILVARALTISVPPQAIGAIAFPTCIAVSVLDTAGNRHTFDPIALLPLSPRDYASVAVATPLRSLTFGGTQGPAGPAGVQSVNGHTGTTITLTAGDVGAPTVDQMNTAIAAGSGVSFATAAALALALG